jgi:hypothetical protein
MHSHTDPAFHDCIELCWSCRDTCQSTLFNYCTEQGGHHVAPGHVRLMMDCIQICQTSADFMTRNSTMHGAICAACAAVCNACAESCEAMNNPKMQKCADICRRCADSCWQMSRMAGGPV